MRRPGTADSAPFQENDRICRCSSLGILGAENHVGGLAVPDQVGDLPGTTPVKVGIVLVQDQELNRASWRKLLASWD